MKYWYKIPVFHTKLLTRESKDEFLSKNRNTWIVNIEFFRTLLEYIILHNFCKILYIFTTAFNLSQVHTYHKH